MKMPEPIAGFQWNSGWRHWEQVIPSAMREEGVVPMFTADQLREALAQQVEELKQLQEQNTALDAKLASHEAVMRMALEALTSDEHCNCIPTPLTDKAIAALEEQLK